MNYRKLDLVQGSIEWKLARFDHVTASNVPCLFGLSPYKTALQYATELLSKSELDQSDGKEVLFAYGHQVEAAAREWCRAQLGHDLNPTVVVSNGVPCLMASLDGLDEEKGIVFEAKYVGREALRDIKAGKLKPHHEYQIQAQLLATGFSKGIYFAMDPDGEAAVMDVAPIGEYQANIKQAVTEFWANLQDGKLPEPTDKDTLLVNDPQLSMLADLDAQLGTIQTQYDLLKAEILARYENNARVQGGGVSITKAWRKGSVDYGKVPQLKGVDLERFRKAGQLVTTLKIKRVAS